MTSDDLKVLTEIGYAIWVDQRARERSLIDTLVAVSLIEMDRERALERAAQALLERAEREGAATQTRMNLEVIHQPFYRLPIRARYLLAGVYRARWSYQRLARIFGVTDQEVESMLWKARLSLATTQYPAAPKGAGPNCPNYDAQRPWTQRYLDEEGQSGSERLFLQAHLMSCPGCQEALNRCRELIASIDKTLPLVADDLDFQKRLARLIQKGRSLSDPGQMSFSDSLIRFFKRPEALMGLAVLLFMLGLLVLRALQ